MLQETQMPGSARLPEIIYASGITFITGVPDSEFREIIAELEYSDLNQRYVLATREDNAIALAVGAYLAGEKPLVFMESSGIGNAIDALTSLAIVYEVPILLLVAWAGYKGHDVPHHNVIGEPLLPLLKALGVPSLEMCLGDPLEAIAVVFQQAITKATLISQPVAVLVIPEELCNEKR